VVWSVVAGAGVVTGAADPAAGSGDDARTATPHLLQNRVPGVRAAPQELQNAINHLAGCNGNN
jgi:hypothetical protein